MRNGKCIGVLKLDFKYLKIIYIYNIYIVWFNKCKFNLSPILSKNIEPLFTKLLKLRVLNDLYVSDKVIVCKLEAVLESLEIFGWKFLLPYSHNFMPFKYITIIQSLPSSG